MKDLYVRIRNFKLPKNKEWSLVFSSFSKKEWLFFFVLILLFLTSALYILNNFNKSLMIEVPTTGGTITEGIIGTPRFINPILAFSEVDRDLSAIIYSGLLRKNLNGDLELDLAEKYELGEDGKTYTFVLKEDIYFHDEKPVTAEDIVFTVTEAKNPVLRTANGTTWDNIEARAKDSRTIEFSLRNPDPAFLENLTLGILPAHLWRGFPMELSELNTTPIGSGPYKIKKTGKEPQGMITSYELIPFKKFVFGKPYLEKLNLRFYVNETELITALEKKEVDQISQISPKNAALLATQNYRFTTYLLPRVFGIFFNQNENQIFLDKNIITAIDVLIDKKMLVKEVLFGFGKVAESPILENLKISKEPVENNLTKEERIQKAEELLGKSGWQKNGAGLLEKGGEILSFSISTSNSEDLALAAQLIKENLALVGIQIEIKTFETGDLNQSVIRPRTYDALLFGEIVNRSSDLFAFWHSSQRKDPGLNVAMYTSVKVDKILEEALTILDPEKRVEKYLEFEAEIIKEKPAIFLYSPSFIYVFKNDLSGVSGKYLTSAKDRFTNLHEWYLKTDKVWKIFAKN